MPQRNLLPCPFCGDPGEVWDIAALVVRHVNLDGDCPIRSLAIPEIQWSRRALSDPADAAWSERVALLEAEIARLRASGESKP